MEETKDNKQKSQNNNYKNYLRPLKRTNERDETKSMRGKEDLHEIIHKLKGHYNDLMKIKNKKTAKLNDLKKKKQELSKQIENKLAFSNIELPLERIKIDDYDKFKNSNETKQTIQDRIENLMLQKENFQNKYENEIEYSKKINNLIFIEKQNNRDLFKHTVDLKDKINTLYHAEKNLELNREEKLKKEKIFNNIKKEMDSEMMRLEDVTDYQTKNYNKMIEENKIKNEENKKYMKEIDMRDSNLDKEHKKNADKILSQINKSKMIKKENTEKENYVIKLILGLDIIKKYFIDIDTCNKEINTTEIVKSDDLKTFNSEKFSIKTTENLDSRSSDTPYNSDNQMKSNIEDNSKNEENTNNSKEKIREKERNKKCKISLKFIKDKLDNLDLNYDSVFDFYTKIMNKTNFYHNQIMNLNTKQINLESKKEKSMKRVKDIIKKNSKNIEGLKKFNSKFVTLLNTFEKEINVGNLYENLKEKIKNFDPCPKICLDFYVKCENYFSDMRTFTSFLKFNFKKMKSECMEEILRNYIKENYKILKENIKSEKNSDLVSNVDYIKDLINLIETEILKENKILEKIQIAIDSYSKNKSIVKEISFVRENKIEEKEKNKIIPFSKINIIEDKDTEKEKDIKEENNETIYINNKNLKEECMENSSIDLNLFDKNNKIKDLFNKDDFKSNINLDNFVSGNLDINNLEEKPEDNKSLHKSEEISSKISYIEKKEREKLENDTYNNMISINENPSWNINLNNMNIAHTEGDYVSRRIDIEEINKKELSIKTNPNSIRNSDISGNVYITPYSGWSLRKLEKEKDKLLKKIEYYKKQIEVGIFFQSEINLINLSRLEVPFEKTLFYFFDNIEKLIDNINISKSIVDKIINSTDVSRSSRCNTKPSGSWLRKGTMVSQSESIFFIFLYFDKFYR